MSEDVSILGSGVVGLASALWLEMQGYDTRVYAEHIPYQTPPSERVHSVASNYAAASIIPHGINCPEFDEVMTVSQDVFRILSQSAAAGVRSQRHYKVYESGQHDCLPQYARHMERFSTLNRNDLPTESIPCRSGVSTEDLTGWVYPSYFVEMPVYVSSLLNMYKHLGGQFVEGRLTRDEFVNLPGDVLMNCAGYGARELVDDSAPFYAARGHLVHVYADEFPTEERGRPYSYNYYPDDDQVDDGLEGSVYAYPRTDALVLGGSRIRSQPPVDGESDASGIEADTTSIDGVEVPTRIIETNGDILQQTSALDINEYNWEAFEGWRPVRDPDGEGVRIEASDVDGRTVVHNYGHGGAGVTLSWGTASKAAEIVREVVGEREDSKCDPSRRLAVIRHLQRYVVE